MLGKLLKYEWKSTGRVLPLIYLAIVALAVCVGISLRASMIAEEGIGSALLVGIYMVLIMAMIIVTIIVIIERFFRSMISQEGYLMHTLPVKTWQHVLSKTIMAIIWTAIAIAVIVVSLLLIGSISGLLEELAREIGFKAFVNELEFFMTRSQFAMMIVCGIVQVIRLIMQAYAAMAIGGSSTKNKVAFSFLAFIVMVVVVSVIASSVSMGVMFGTVNSPAYDMFLMGLEGTTTTVSQDFGFLFGRMVVMQLIMDGALLAVFFILTNHFLKKKLNLE